MTTKGYETSILAAQNARDTRLKQIATAISELNHGKFMQLPQYIENIERLWRKHVMDAWLTETDVLHRHRSSEVPLAHLNAQPSAEQGEDTAVILQNDNAEETTHLSNGHFQAPKPGDCSVVQDTDHPLVVRFSEDRWAELRCRLCPGKGVNAHMRNGLPFFKGIKGFMGHLGNVHKDAGPPWGKELVLKECFHRYLDKEEVEAIKVWGEEGYDVEKLILDQNTSPSRDSTTASTPRVTSQQRFHQHSNHASAGYRRARVSSVSDDVTSEPRSKVIRLIEPERTLVTGPDRFEGFSRSS